jgi:hypothetical protein
VDGAVVGQHRAKHRHCYPDAEPYFSRSRSFFAGVDPWRTHGRQPQADRSEHQSGFDLSIQKAAVRGFEPKPELEETEAFGELAAASFVLTRVKPPIVEGAKPLLLLAAWRDSQPRLSRVMRARQPQ